MVAACCAACFSAGRAGDKLDSPSSSEPKESSARSRLVLSVGTIADDPGPGRWPCPSAATGRDGFLHAHAGSRSAPSASSQITARSKPTGGESGRSTWPAHGGRWRRRSPNILQPCNACCSFAELDPDHALVRWGNFDRTVLLPGKVFEADETGRSYRFRPNVRSIWVRNFPVKGQVKAYFQVLDTPEVAELLKGTGAQIVEGSVQTTNSWGLRGPEPNLKASWRGIVLGDSYMQGLFVGDQETPTECLKRELKSRLQAPVEILNTGHLGYSPEQYYYTLVEYGRRFPPQFVVVSIFANDFGGDVEAVLLGNGDVEEARYWLWRIREYCLAREAHFLVVPAPWVKQIEEPQLAGNYPGRFSNVLEATGLEYLDPIDDFVNAHLADSLSLQERREVSDRQQRCSTGASATLTFQRRDVASGPRPSGVGSSS